MKYSAGLVKPYLIRAGVVLSLFSVVGCAMAPPKPTTYSLNSNPEGADIYIGKSPDSLRYYATTPFQKTVSDFTKSLRWSEKYFQARKKGYHDSPVHHQPTIPWGNRIPINFELKPKDGEFVLAPYKARNTLVAYYEFLEAYPESVMKPRAFELMIALIKSKKDKDKEYRRLLNSYPEAANSLPEGVRLSYIGPEGMRVADLANMLKQGFASVILEQKVVGTNKPYVEFSFSEIKQLKKMGLTDSLIAAMLKATQQYKDKAEEARIRAEQAQKLQQQARNNRAAVVSSMPVQQTNSAPGVGDVLQSCAEFYAKRKACENLGFFGSKVCMAALPGGEHCQ